MRLLLLTLYFQPDTATNAIYMGKLAHGLATRGHEVTVVAALPHYRRPTIWPEYRNTLHQVEHPHPNLEVRRIWVYAPRDQTAPIQRLFNYLTFDTGALVTGLCMKASFDVVFSVSPPLTLGIVGRMLALRHNSALAYGIQDLWPLSLAEKGILDEHHPLYRLLLVMEQYVYRTADGLVALGPAMKQHLRRHSVGEERIAVIPNGTDPDAVHPLPRDTTWRQEIGLDDEFVILYAGNIGPGQGVDVMLDCALRSQEHDDWAWVIVGDGLSRAELKHKVKRSQLENVHMFPYQPRERVPEVLASADVSLVLTRAGVGSTSVPSKSLNIMASARPLIAAVDSNSDLAHLVEKVGCGLLVPPENPDALIEAIERAYRKPAQRRAWGEAGRAYLEQHLSHTAMVDDYEAFFLRLTRSPD